MLLLCLKLIALAALCVPLSGAAFFALALIGF
jgi:hypothetical protein